MFLRLLLKGVLLLVMPMASSSLLTLTQKIPPTLLRNLLGVRSLFFKGVLLLVMPMASLIKPSYSNTKDPSYTLKELTRHKIPILF